MNVWAWFLLAYLAADAIWLVAIIGRPREPVTPGAAAIALVFLGFLALAVVKAAT